MPAPTIPPPRGLDRNNEIFSTRAEPAQPAPDNRLRARLVRLTLSRVIAITGLLTIVLVGSSGDPSSTLTWTIVAVYVVSIAYAVWLGFGRNLRRLAVLQIALDLFAYVAVAIVTGGPASPLGFFVAVPALSAALVLGSNAARVTAAASAVSYGLVTIAYLYRWPTAFWIGKHFEMSRDELAVQLVAQAVAIPLVAALGGALAERLRRAGGALVELENQRADLVALHEDVLRSIPVGLVTVGASGEIESANPVAEVLLGKTGAALVGTSVREALAFVEPSAFASTATVAGTSRASEEPDAPFIAWTLSPLVDRNGVDRGRLVVLEDRTSSEQLRAQVERAEKLAVLGRLAAGMAHEIRNPLGAISGCVELVRESESLAAEDRELLSTVLRESARLNRLVGDMLAFARPRPPELERAKLFDLVREFASIASKESGISPPIVVESLCERDVVAMVDPQQLRQVLWNLVRNGGQASPDGSPVELWVARESEQPAIFVADRGVGIARESREKIFESFYSERSSRGTGLGLAVVRQIVDAHKGSIEPRERDGGGTVFVLRLRPPSDEGA
ncbi:MAG: hypothetical protein JNK05_04745 [Myxococcales bacterium]|nr:hypothetical protein [Myxococcales bacterium]